MEIFPRIHWNCYHTTMEYSQHWFINFSMKLEAEKISTGGKQKQLFCLNMK
jgi:hypothetical protein